MVSKKKSKGERARERRARESEGESISTAFLASGRKKFLCCFFFDDS